MSEMKIEVFAFNREAVRKVLFQVAVEIEDGPQIDVPSIVRVLRSLFPKSIGVTITFY